MTTQTDTTPAPTRKTTAGNYFVSNYPPFSFWSPDRRVEALEALGRKPVPGTPLGVYVHLPFCRKRCHFCYFRVYTGKDAKRDRVTQYVDSVLEELDLYARTPLIAGRRPRYVYFGGGTPSFLTPEQLAQLFDGMKRILPWDEVEEVTFECEPGTLDEEKLRALHLLGVTRLSLGIENFDDEILAANNRAHRSREIYRAYEHARSIGFHQINIDLIAGMLNETAENWQQTAEKAIELGADCVTIYQMEIPYNTTIYAEMRDRGAEVAPVADWPTKRAWVASAYEQLERAGYTVTSAYTAVRDPETFRFQYRDYLWTGADMASLGISSFGHFQGTHYQNEKDFGPYRERLARGELPIHRALTMTDEERFVREAILQMKRGRLDRGYFLEKFGEDILVRFDEPLRSMREGNLAAVDEGGVTLSREGLLRADELLHGFFLPQHRRARYT